MEFTSFNYTPIPKLFQKDATGGYFDKCISCECNLLEEDVDYLIEKALKPYAGLNSYATVFEYAICWPCSEAMRQTLSKESRENIANYFDQNLDLESRRQALKDPENSPQVEDWLGTCAVSKASASSLKELQIYGHFQGKQMVFHHYPFMLGGPVMDELIHLISNKTLDDLQRFTDQLTSGPPEFADLLKTGPRVFI